MTSCPDGVYSEKNINIFMRLKEFTTGQNARDDLLARQAPVEKPSVNDMVLKTIANYISRGNWAGAITAGAIAAAPQLKPYLSTDQYRVLNYAVNTYSAANFWTGLSAFAAKVGVPFLSLAGWSGKLNTGEEEELSKKWRIAQAERDFAP
jgi:hypothetical protein